MADKQTQTEDQVALALDIVTDKLFAWREMTDEQFRLFGYEKADRENVRLENLTQRAKAILVKAIVGANTPTVTAPEDFAPEDNKEQTATPTKPEKPSNTKAVTSKR